MDFFLLPMSQRDHTASKRRRHRRSAPIEEVAVPPPSTRRRPAKGASPVRGWQRWRRGALASLGASPVFRAYIFLGSIAAILAFLLYNESIIAELREHEKNRVDLYAHLISFAPQASEGQIPTLFTEVITKVNFPRIITNHRGEIIQAEDINTSSLLGDWVFWRSEAADVPTASTAQLHRLIEEMDLQNPPIPFYWSPETLGRLYCEEGRVIIADTQGAIAAWQGTGLPASSDTSAAALAEVQRALREMEAGQSLSFSVPAASFSYLHWDGTNAIIEDVEGRFRTWVGAGLPLLNDAPSEGGQDQLRAFVDSLAKQRPPLEFRIPAEHYIHYSDTSLVDRISLAPFVQIGVLFLFLLVGYIGYRNIKRSQQRSLWVGMAKETAHQLGTPLSSLAGWLELLRGEVAAAPRPDRDERWERVDQMIGEIQQDKRRLDQIASRFSQIGSVPELEEKDVAVVLEETIEYFRRRVPQFGRQEIELECLGELPPVPINAELMSWAFENLCKNAIDAMDGQTGHLRIRTELVPEGRAVQISFQDDGRGIEPEHVKRIFEPGFSTKKRGWGLGLVFVKRIVEEYHKGKISLVHSAPGEGTTFEVILPLD